MPLHDWSRVPAGLFHDFHQSWSVAIKNSLNCGRLPPELYALVEQKAGKKEGDVLAIEMTRPNRRHEYEAGNVLTLDRPATRIIRHIDRDFYIDKANRIVIRHRLGRIVAVIEIVSPANKDRKSTLQDFIEKIAGYIEDGVHVLVIDMLPPTLRDPHGIHKAIWDLIFEEDCILPPGKDRILAAYEAGTTKSAYVELIGLGDPMPEMPLFVTAGAHVRVPLESAYQATWDVMPAALREIVETGVLPEMDGDEE